MNVFIVFAHPEHRSFNGAMLDAAQSALRSSGARVEISDLYAMGFNPVPGRHDFHSTHSSERFSYEEEQWHAHHNDGFREEIKLEQEKLLRADLVILQFPLWWFSMPAILKGWVDRVLAYGFAYGGGRWYDEGVFANKKAMIAVTVGGVETAYGPDGLQGDIDKILYPIQHGILQYVGFQVLQPFIAYSANYADVERRAQVLAEYKKRLEQIDAETPVPPTRISDYDGDLRRL